MADDTTTSTTSETASSPPVAATPSATPTPTPSTPSTGGTTEKVAAGWGLGQGPGRLLLWFYGVFTVAALSRSIVQISTQFHDAPLAYLLSLAAGVVYGVITLALWRGGEQARRVALVSCSAELLGVVSVGIATVVDSSAFPDQTVWSDFGNGYVFLPVLLPVVGLLWLRRSGRRTDPAAS